MIGNPKPATGDTAEVVSMIVPVNLPFALELLAAHEGNDRERGVAERALNCYGSDPAATLAALFALACDYAAEHQDDQAGLLLRVMIVIAQANMAALHKLGRV